MLYTVLYGPSYIQLEDFNHDQCLPMPKTNLLAFQRAEKEKYMSSKPLAKHQGTAYMAKPIMTSNVQQLVLIVFTACFHV